MEAKLPPACIAVTSGGELSGKLISANKSVNTPNIISVREHGCDHAPLYSGGDETVP